MTAVLKQILLMTDGHSNEGEDPVAIARLAQEHGICINVIGITEEGPDQYRGLEEIEAIALAGGGVSEIVTKKQLVRTVQTVTRRAMTQTLQHVVQQELKHIFPEKEGLHDVSPDDRGQIVEVTERLGEAVSLEVLVLIDTSASMTDKLPMVQEALMDLSLSLNARLGDSLFCLYSFPGKSDPIDRLVDWTPRLTSLTQAFAQLTPKGLTPTGPALQAGIGVFSSRREKRRRLYGEQQRRARRLGN
ncbi:hypothetical protein NSQ26_10695 [Bacillus sp. FSL W7-1360]